MRVIGELWIDGVDARSLADRKARQVLRLLALARGRSVTTTSLAEALWGAASPSRPADQIAVLVSRLRRSLGREAIEYGDNGYRLVYTWLDLDELAEVTVEAERRIGSGNTGGAVAAARLALALVRGPVPEPITDLDWVVADDQAARRLVQRARRVAASAMLGAGEWPDALDLAAADLQADPYDEDAARLVMRAQVLAGRPSAALAVFADLRSRLADELGADPAAETIDLNAAILRGDRATSEPAATDPGHAFVGRTRQLTRLDELADAVPESPVQLVAVVGEAGIGKSSLLSTWARQREHRGQTVLFGTCGALDRSSPLDVVLGAIAEHLRRAADPNALLGEDRALLAPLLGTSLDAALGTRIQDLPRAAMDPVLGPATLYAAVTAVLDRIAGADGAIVLLDDAHLAGPALGDWALFALRRPARLLIVAAARPAEGSPFPSTTTLTLGPLDRDETAELVGDTDADDLHARSGGNPLFLSELTKADASHAPDGVPLSLVAVIDQRCDQLGPAAEVLRASAVLGTELDIDLIASVLGRSALEVLADVELAEDRGLLVERAGRHAFRHELVRAALASGSRAGRSALLHREASRVLARRAGSDPVAVAEHARLGGDLEQAAASLRTAADRAAERFDHATAESLLDQSLSLHPTDAARLERARLRVRRGRYAAAHDDVTATRSAGAEGWEISAWAAYFDRRFDDAIRFARDGELIAEEADVRTRCLMVGGRTLHAGGDLSAAETKLASAAESAVGPDRLTAAAWLGVLRAHRGQYDDALDLLAPITHPGAGADLTSATLHALLFTGHAHALAGRPEAALVALARYTAEVERRQVPRFSGRGTNMAGWVLRHVGARDRGLEAHQQALQLAAGGPGRTEMQIAALEDLAEDHLEHHELDDAERLLYDAGALFTGDLVFGWRLELKLALLRTRLDLLAGNAEQAQIRASGLVESACTMGVPRYATVGRTLCHQAAHALGEPVDPTQVRHDLTELESANRLEAWWWTGATGAALGDEELITRAETLAAHLARASGEHGDAVRTHADRAIGEWRLRTR